MAQAEAIFPDGEAHQGSINSWGREVARQFIDWMAIPAGQRWLEVGAGEGAFAEELTARYAPSDMSRLDPLEPPAEQEAFDAAVMALAITQMPDPLVAARQMVRALRPGGWMGAYMWDLTGGGAPTYPICAGAKDLGVPFDTIWEADFSRLHILRDLWREIGLVDVEPRVFRIRMSYDSFDDYWDANAQDGPMAEAIQSLTPQMRTRLQDHLRATLPADRYGRIAFHAWVNAVKGRVAAP